MAKLSKNNRAEQELERLIANAKAELEIMKKKKSVMPIYQQIFDEFLKRADNSNEQLRNLIKGVVSDLPKKSQKALLEHHDWLQTQTAQSNANNHTIEQN